MISNALRRALWVVTPSQSQVTPTTSSPFASTFMRHEINSFAIIVSGAAPRDAKQLAES